MIKDKKNKGRWNNFIAKNTGINPFAASITSVTKPNFFPITRETFVAPRLPLPAVVRSIPPLNFATMAEVGMLPSKYDANI